MKDQHSKSSLNTTGPLAGQASRSASESIKPDRVNWKATLSLSEQIDGMYDALIDLRTHDDMTLEHGQKIRESVAKLRALQEQDARELEARFNESLSFTFEEADNVIAEAKSLLNNHD